MYTLVHIHPLPSPHTAELSRPNINGKRSCSSAAVLNHGHSMAGDISYTSREMDVQMTLASPRHFLRRGGMVQDQLQDHLCSSKLAQVKTIYNLLVGCHTYKLIIMESPLIILWKGWADMDLLQPVVGTGIRHSII